MIEKVIHIVKLIIAILPFVALCLSTEKINLEKRDRSRQFLMPVVALIYVIVAMLLLDNINDWITRLVNNIPKWIAGLSEFPWMPEVMANVFTKISRFIVNFLEEINLRYWMFFISNTVIIMAYVVIKKIVIEFSEKFIKQDGALHSKIAPVFYRYFYERSFWCLKEDYFHVKGFLRVFYFAAVLICTVLTLVSTSLYQSGQLQTIFYPVFGILVVGEVFFFLDGLTENEYGDIMGEDEQAYRMVNYSLLRKFLRSLFKDKLLAENTSLNSPLVYSITTDDIIRDLEKNEDQKITSFAAYMKAYNASGAKVDHNYLYSSLEMLKGKSVLFNNPFYKDLIPYAFYPMNRALLSHQKVLVVLGRHAVEEDIKEWIEQGIGAVTNIPFMWDMQILDSEPKNPDIGIMTRSDVLDIKLHDANSEFLEEVGFVVIIEPSKLITTAQIGLNMIMKRCRTSDDKNIVYCMCDKNCDGLVDAMSHILMTSITEVSATNKHTGTSSYMNWSADKEYLHHRLLPNISRYLGVGTELSFAALKNQVSKTEWYGGEAFPVVDMRWIDRQYYYDLTKYAGIPTSQESMDEFFRTSANFWSAGKEDNCYITVEDESFNMFEVLRDFSTRATNQGFINVISSEYMLKDYMADNASIFETDAKAIPHIVADFTRSNRNTTLRLILMMSIRPVNVSVLERELSLIGITVYDLQSQLWFEIYKCFAPVKDTAELMNMEYTEAVKAAAERSVEINKTEFSADIFRIDDTFNIKLGKMETIYSIKDELFFKNCVKQLKSASYIAEDEKGERHYLGAELAGHVFQKFLPGQFFTFGGKYYEMQYITADGQVMVRRAADHINGRPAYRQIRNYYISGINPSDKIGAIRNVAGLKISREFADIRVETPGYYDMESYNNFVSARKILFEGNGIPSREYRSKELLRIELPDMGGKLNDKIRYTVTMLFNEIFKTLFAENQAYICAVTADSFIEADAVRPVTFSVDGEGIELNENSVYIIEDSQLDLGLTVAVERNLQRIMEIMHDYLDWHGKTLEESLVPPPPPPSPVEFTDEDDEGDGKKKGFFGKVLDKIRGMFKKKPKDKKKKKKKGENEGDEPSGSDVPTGDTPQGDTPSEDTPQGDTPSGDTPEENTPAEDTPDGDTPSEDTPPASDDSETPSEDAEKAPKKGFFKRMKEKREKRKKEKKEKKEKKKLEKQLEKEKKKQEKEMKKKKKGTEEVPENPEVPETPETSETPELPENEENSQETEEAENTENHDKNAPSDVEYKEAPVEQDEPQVGIIPERKAYHDRYYLLFGDVNEPTSIDQTATKDYLAALGLAFSPLSQAREGKNIARIIEATYKPGKAGSRYCDFCGTEIYGVEYETLADGRDRCLHCSRTAIKSGEEFKKLYEDVKRNMESFFGIRINVGVKVEMVNSKKLHKRLGESFTPSPKQDGRVLGVAIKGRNGFSLLIENGSPRMMSMLTIAHELTHIWQYISWNQKAIRKKYGKALELEIYEGMAKWVEVQYAYLINEPALAKRTEIITAFRDDEYGRGFLRYRENYPFSLGTYITRNTPFMDEETPLDPDYCGTIRVILPKDDSIGLPLDDDEADPDRTNGKKPQKVMPTSEEATDGPSDRDAENVPHYFYDRLSEGEQLVYDQYLDAIMGFKAEIVGLAADLKLKQAQRIMDYVLSDHPEIFWIYYNERYFYDVSTQIVNKVVFEYRMTEEEAERRQEEIQQKIRPFLDSITDSMSDYEVALKVYENIINLVDYDTIGLERQKKTPIVERNKKPDDLRSIYGVFVEKKAVCAGYAKAMQFLLNVLGIECLYITSETHAWNIVKLEGDYYHVDVTWGDGSNTRADKNFGDAIDYGCFCITTEEVLRLDSHKPEDFWKIPVCTAVKCNYYRRHGLYFDQFDYDKLRAIICERIEQGEDDVAFKFASDALYATAKKNLVDGGKFMEALRYSNTQSDRRVDMRYMYVESPPKRTITFSFKYL